MKRIVAPAIGGAIGYAVNVWILRSATNPMMAFDPRSVFYLAPLVFALVVGLLLVRVGPSRMVTPIVARPDRG